MVAMSELARLSFYDESTEQVIGDAIDSEWVPRVGDVVLVDGGDWTVMALRWLWPMPGSITRGEGSFRPLVDVKVAQSDRWWRL